MRKFLLVSLFLAGILQAQTPQISLQPFASGFSRPVDIENAGDSRLFVVEQRGYVYILDSLGNQMSPAFLDIDSRVINSGNERGLLGLVFHPDYKNNGYFYVNYSNNSGNSVIARYSVSATNPNEADVNSELILMTVTQPFSNHNAGDLAFGPDGYLYIGWGDGGSGGDPGNRSQNTNLLLGKMLRIDVDNGIPYGIPQDNPFVNDANVLDEIWAIGVRNPWRFSFDRITGDMYIADVGQNNWEEVDFQPWNSTGGENYGWRCYEGSATYNTSGCPPASSLTPPIFEYSNSNAFGCSITGGFVYRGARYSAMYGHYLVTDYCSGRWWSLKRDVLGNWVDTDLANLSNFEYSSLGQDQFGELYVAGHGNGIIYHIEDTSCTPVAFIMGGDTQTVCSGLPLQALEGAGLSYQWFLNGNPITGATSASYVPTQGGSYSVEVANGNCDATSGVISVTVTPAPVVSFTAPGLDTTQCIQSPPIPMQGSPAGGMFSGPGVSNDTLYPDRAGIGTHMLTYTYTDNNGCFGSETITYTLDNCVGLNDALIGESMQILPNPNVGNFELSFSSATGGEALVQVLDVQGKTAWQGTLQVNSGSNRSSLNVGDLSAGVYTLVLTFEGVRNTQKLILTNEK